MDLFHKNSISKKKKKAIMYQYTNAALLYFIIESVKLVEKPDSKKSLLDKLYNKKF